MLFSVLLPAPEKPAGDDGSGQMTRRRGTQAPVPVMPGEVPAET